MTIMHDSVEESSRLFLEDAANELNVLSVSAASEAELKTKNT